MFKVVQANDNTMALLRMAFPLPKHQHEINVSCTANFPQGLAHEAIRHLKASVIPVEEMTATVFASRI